MPNYSGTPTAEGDDELGSVARSLRSMAEHFRHMLERLAEESSRRETILGSIKWKVLAEADHNLRITFYNDAFARAVHAATPVQGGLSVLNVVRDPALRELLLRVATSGKATLERMSLIHADGHVFDVQAVPMAGQDGAGVIATFHDITELERLERVRKDFVANISHELRTPLAAIYGYTETLLEGALSDPENSRKFLEIIAAHTTRLTNLASDLLMLSEIEAERIPDTERISAVEVAEEALHAVAAQANERHVLAYLNAADDVYIAGQKGRVQRAIINLLLNAINYNRTGGEVRIDVARVEETARISVTDNGTSESRRRILPAFSSASTAWIKRSRQTGGTGLGLSIVRNTVERMGGSVTVTFQLGEGSVFTLVFPLA